MTASVAYLDQVAGSAGRDYKREQLAALAPAPGHRVLDVGCGPGTDLTALADVVGPTGAVFGVDHDPVMVATARERTAGHTAVTVYEADAHTLPFPDRSIDRARVDRVLMHVDKPGAVLAELRRVLRPGGRLTLAEPDWDTLAIDHPELAISRAFTAFIAHRMHRNSAIGRQLPRLAAQAGFELAEVRNAAVVLTDFAAAESLLGLERNTRRAVAAGYLSAHAAEVWLAYLRTGRFFATVSFISVLAQAPHEPPAGHDGPAAN